MKPIILTSVAVAAVATQAVVGLGMTDSFGEAFDPDQAFSAPGLDPMTFNEGQEAFYRRAQLERQDNSAEPDCRHPEAGNRPHQGGGH